MTPELWIISSGLYYLVVVRYGGQSIRLKRFDSDHDADVWRERLRLLIEEQA